MVSGHPNAAGSDQPPPPAELVAWIDGRCALCRRAGRWIEARDRLGRIWLRDLHHAAPADLPGPREAMLARLWVVACGPDGRPEVSTGLDAVRQVLLRLPGWRWPARLMAWPLVGWLGSLAYRIVARHRQRLGQMLGCDGSACRAGAVASRSSDVPVTRAQGRQSSTGTGSPRVSAPSQDATKIS
jgi:predicted DCC family thiol-disulfide oxidoreductase YuxK